MQQNLRAIGSDLLVVVGKPEDVIPQYLLEGAGATNLVLTQVRAVRLRLLGHNSLERNAFITLQSGSGYRRGIVISLFFSDPSTPYTSPFLCTIDFEGAF